MAAFYGTLSVSNQDASLPSANSSFELHRVSISILWTLLYIYRFSIFLPSNMGV